MRLEGIITYSIDYLTCLIPLSESFSIFWVVSESILAPILCVGWVKNGCPMRSSADTPILALKISLDGHFPSSYIKIEGKYTACAFNFCHLRPLHSDITGPEFRPRLIILWPTNLTIGWIPRNFKIFIISLNCHFWGKITKLITSVIFTDSPYIWFLKFRNSLFQEISEIYI